MYNKSYVQLLIIQSTIDENRQSSIEKIKEYDSKLDKQDSKLDKHKRKFDKITAIIENMMHQNQD